MALDEPKDTDHIYEISGFTYIVNKEFMDEAKPIKIDFTPMGFKVDCGIDLGENCSSCGTDTSCS